MKTQPKITEAEWAVMKILWSKYPLTGNAVADQLRDTRDWNPKTVKTLLTRLVNKKVVGFEKEGREYHYYPLIKEQTCKSALSRSFLNQIFDGSLKPMLVTVLECEELSDKDIHELKAILEEKERG